MHLHGQRAYAHHAVISDNTGRMRPGVFEDAMRKVNLLQPEFVVNVGDLIEGYTEDPAELERQWKDLDGKIAGLEMPFFFVPGGGVLVEWA
jgi:hypothetical protein